MSGTDHTTACATCASSVTSRKCSSRTLIQPPHHVQHVKNSKKIKSYTPISASLIFEIWHISKLATFQGRRISRMPKTTYKVPQYIHGAWHPQASPAETLGTKDCLGCSCSCLLLTCTTIFERLAERYSIRSEEGNKSQCSCDVVCLCELDSCQDSIPCCKR